MKKPLNAFDKFMVSVVVLLAAVTLGAVAANLRAPKAPAFETIYVVNKAPQFISDKTIQQDIPAWEAAANKDFAPYWNTNQLKIELVKKVPIGGIGAYFVKRGNVQGALAYHTISDAGSPEIIVYAGTDDYYGYSNSVSFTHEMFELLADQYISAWREFWIPFPYVTVGGQRTQLPPNTVWFQEVCDPVEEQSYKLDGVAISDFITPAWFGDWSVGKFDFEGLTHAPLTVLHGGYAQFQSDGQYYMVQAFAEGGRDASGYYKAEGPEEPK